MFKKGQSGNPLGRPVGAKRLPTDIKQEYKSIVEGNLSNVGKWLEKVGQQDPVKALDFTLRMSEFILPRINSNH